MEDKCKAPTWYETGTNVFEETASDKREQDENPTRKDEELDTAPATGHDYKATFNWTEKEDSEGKGTGEVEKVSATVECVNGCEFEATEVKVSYEKVEDKCNAPTCTETGTNVYQATVTFKDADGKKPQRIPLAKRDEPSYRPRNSRR